MRVCWCRHLYNRMSEHMPILWRANAIDCGFATVPISGGDYNPNKLRKIPRRAIITHAIYISERVELVTYSLNLMVLGDISILDSHHNRFVNVWVCWSLTSLCHSNGHIETMPAREINPFTPLTRIRSQFLRTQWSTSNHQRVDTTTPQTAEPSRHLQQRYAYYWNSTVQISYLSYK